MQLLISRGGQAVKNVESEYCTMFSEEYFSRGDLFLLEVSVMDDSTKEVVNVNVSFALIVAVVSILLCRNVYVYGMLVVWLVKPELLTIVKFVVSAVVFVFVVVLVANIAVFEVTSFVAGVTFITLLVVKSEFVVIFRSDHDSVSGCVETCVVAVNVNPGDVRSSIGR